MTTQLSLPRRSVVPILIGALVVAGGWLIRAQDETRSGEWRSSGGDSAYRRYSPLAQIKRDNVKNLRIVWRRAALDPRVKEAFPKLRTNNYLRATPTMIGGVLYTPDASGLITALDAATGNVLWRQEPDTGDGERSQRHEHPRRRLLEGRRGPPVVHGPERYLYALDLRGTAVSRSEPADV